jgi:hypothetical protein
MFPCHVSTLELTLVDLLYPELKFFFFTFRSMGTVKSKGVATLTRASGLGRQAELSWVVIIIFVSFDPKERKKKTPYKDKGNGTMARNSDHTSQDSNKRVREPLSAICDNPEDGI